MNLLTVAAAGVFLSPVVSGQAPFTEESAPRGLNDFLSAGEAETYGFGVAFADLDGDGDPDLVTLGRADHRIGLYENDGAGYFTLRSAGSGMALESKPSGVVAGDYDGDSDLDLFITVSIGNNRLYRNEGAFTFTDVTTAAGVGDNGAGMGCAFGDVDGDGDLDLYVSNHTVGVAPNVNQFFSNNGDGTFTEMAALLGLDFGSDPTYQAVLFDMERDGDVDLYLATDKGYQPGLQNHLMENQGNGTFTEITFSSGTAALIDAMGLAVGDFDRNGQVDLYVTNTSGGNVLYLQQTTGVFSDGSALYGVLNFALGWGTLFFDYDNNTHLDLYVCNSTLAPNRLYVHDGRLPSQDLASTLGIADTGKSYGSATADIDNDGDLDLAVSNEDGIVSLYINQEGSTRSWVKFDVVGTQANLHGVGATVEVRTGSLWQTRLVLAGSSYKSQDDLRVEFGLDSATLVDEVRVTWPGGEERCVTNLTGRHTWRLLPDERLGDVDEDGDVDRDDYFALWECFTGAIPGALQPGCEAADMDRDGDVDFDDARLLVIAGNLYDLSSIPAGGFQVLTPQ